MIESGKRSLHPGPARNGAELFWPGRRGGKKWGAARRARWHRLAADGGATQRLASKDNPVQSNLNGGRQLVRVKTWA